VSTRIGILGQEAGAQGVLHHPNDAEVGRHYLSLPLRYGSVTKTQRGSYRRPGAVRRKVDGSIKWDACVSPKARRTRDGKGCGVIHCRRGLIEARAEILLLVWGPGAGAEGGREALF